MKIAITGTIASGKSTVSNILRRLGYKVFDSDNFAKISYHKNHKAYEEIINLFKNDDILDENEEINLKKISSIIFNDKNKKIKLENIIHPYVIEGIKKFNEKNNNKLSFSEVPLLFESNLQYLFDYIIVVTCNKEIAIQRCIDDRGYTYDEAIKRYNSQLNVDLKIESANYVLYNNGTIKELYEQIINWIKENDKY